MEPYNAYSETRYAIYLRKSRADMELEAMGEGETLARHKKMLEVLAAKHNISSNQITTYKEIVSAESIDDRPEAQRLLQDVSKGMYAGVLVVEIERLARGNTTDQGMVADAFSASHTKIITPAKVYDPDNEFDQEYFEFGLFMSRREYKTIRRRLVTGKDESAKEGNYLLPQRLFGYDIKRLSKKDRILVPNPDEAPIVKMIFDWYTEDRKSMGWIARQMTNMGVKTLKGGAEWSARTIADMLPNEHYIGKITWKCQSTVKVYDEKQGKMVKKKKRGPKQIYEGKHEALISEEQFQKAQKIRADRHAASPIKYSAKLVNPLAGLLRCKSCGLHMEYQDTAKCPGSKHNCVPRFIHKTRKFCKKKSLPVSDVMNALVEVLERHIQNYTYKLESGNDQADVERHQALIKAMEAELAKQEKMKQRLFDSWEADDGMYTRDEFIERKQKYTTTIEKIKEQIQDAKENAPEPVDYAEQIVMLHAAIDRIKDPTVDAEDKNALLKEIIESIDYDAEDYGLGKGGKAILDVHLKK